MIHTGPNSKIEYTEKVKAKINRKQLFIVLSFVFPFFIYGLFHFDLVSSSNRIVNSDTQSAVALVSSFDSQGVLISTGSAVLMSPNLLFTNKHVIENSSTIYLNFKMHPKLSDVEIVAEILYSANGSSLSEDYAVLRIDPNEDLSPLQFGDSDLLNNGDLIKGYGYPGLSENNNIVDFSVSQGIVSNRSFSADTALLKSSLDLFSGNSGGPALNLDDQVIAINTAVSTGKYAGQSFSIKINHILNDPIIQSINWSGQQPLEKLN